MHGRLKPQFCAAGVIAAAAAAFIMTAQPA